MLWGGEIKKKKKLQLSFCQIREKNKKKSILHLKLLLAGEKVKDAFSFVVQHVLLVLLEKSFCQLIVFLTIADAAHGKLGYMFTALVPAQDVHRVQAALQAFLTEGVSAGDLRRSHAGLFLLVGLI